MGLIKKPNELQVKKTLSALIYGQPGMGKTTLALSAPHPLLLDFDGGVHRVNAAHRVDTVQITKWEEVDEVMQSPEIADYATFVIDTAGKMLSFMDKYIMQNNPKMRKADGTLSLQGYGVRKNMFINFVNQVSLMGKSVIFVAHEREEKNGEEKQIRPEIYNPQIQISAESETKRSIFREKDKTKRSKKESAQHSKSRNKSFVMTSVSAL